MNFSSEEGDDQIPIPIPITSKYTMVVHGNHHHHHHHHHPPQNHMIIPSSTGHSKKLAVVVNYRECLRNHAATMGGSVIDGCCEFMPGGKQGSLEALKCSACNCHRNFHRKCILEQEEEEEEEDAGHDQSLYPTTVPLIKPCTSRQQQQQQQPYSQSSKMMMVVSGHSHFHSDHSRGTSYSLLPAGGSSDSDEIKTAPPPPAAAAAVRKRFRSKFTQEQKDKMLSFAEKVGWSIQKEEEGVVVQVCQEIGIKKRVLRVWMHNNKHNYFAKEKSSHSITTN